MKNCLSDVQRTLFAALVVTVCAAVPLPLRAIEPADSELTVEAREVLDYLVSIYGQKTLIGQDKFVEAERFHEATGHYPAIISSDLSGWSETRWDSQYRRTLQQAVDQSKAWWHKQGGIVSFAWHWAHPLTTAGTFEATRPDFAPIDVGRLVTRGTKEHEAAMHDLRRHADYLEQLAKARVPVLWRPLHESEGGWFWWSDTKTPENTAKLWRMMFDYLVHERKLHNLIWVYSAALQAGDHGKNAETIDYRRRFYPGDKYVDISGIDIYTNAWFGWGDFREDSFPKAFQIMGQVTPGKMLALCECQGLPNPDIMAKDGPRWLYCLPWYVGKDPKWNPPDWVKKVHGHELFITLDRLPKWTRRTEGLSIPPIPPSSLASRFMRGICCTTPQQDPSAYEAAISDLAAHGFDVAGGLHGTPANNRKFLELAQRRGIEFIPSIPLICWIRFGDPPYPKTGPLGWDNILAWFQLQGVGAAELPPPFDSGPDGREALSDEALAEQVRNTFENFYRSPEARSVLALYAFDEPVFNRPGVIDRIARAHEAVFRCGRSAARAGRQPVITGIFFWDKESQQLARQYMLKSTGRGDPPTPRPPCLMYDCYVLAGEPGEGLAEYENYARQWVEVGREFAVPVIVVPLAFTVDQRPGANEMRAQAYLALASGCKGVNWFRYETIKAMPPERWEEVHQVNKELAAIGPTLMQLHKIENVASLSGCGGRHAENGLINTFVHEQTSRKHLFLASRDMFATDAAKVAIRKDRVGYRVDWLRDCLTGKTIAIQASEDSIRFSIDLEPGGGRLIELGTGSAPASAPGLGAAPSRDGAARHPK